MSEQQIADEIAPPTRDELMALSMRFAKAALNLFARDPHRFSSRPCDTCKAISEILDEPWGCETQK